MREKLSIAVTFARPEESRAFRRSLANYRRLPSDEVAGFVGLLGENIVRGVHTGIGVEAAAKAAGALLTEEGIRVVIGAGFAGGLAPGLRCGDLIMQRDAPAGEGARQIVSRPLPVETVEAKAALFRETGAQAVDMETETLATACHAKGVEFFAVRAISDTAGEPLPVPFRVWFNIERQRPRVLRLLAWLALHPAKIAPFARFVRGLAAVSEKLAVGIEKEIRTLGG